MCPVHHDIVDATPERYSAEWLQEVKEKHEQGKKADSSEPSDTVAAQLLAHLSASAPRFRRNESIQQIIIGDINVTGGQVTIAPQQGLTEPQIDQLATLIVERSTVDVDKKGSEDAKRLRMENADLKKQLAAAIRCVEQAESVGLADARGLIEALRKGGDTSRLLKFLLARRDLVGAFKEKAEKECVSLNRQIAAVAYLRRDLHEAASALAQILEVEPKDLDALNRMGHICLVVRDNDGAERYYQRALDVAEKAVNLEGQMIVLANLGHVQMQRGRIEAGIEFLRKSVEIDRKIGHRAIIGPDIIDLGPPHI
jgi:tetratricopeptide (TPR) repeat protein